MKNYFKKPLLGVALVLALFLQIFSIQALAVEEGVDKVGNIVWVSRRDSDKHFKVNQKIEVPFAYKDKNNNAEINLIYYDLNGKTIDMRDYDVFYSNSKILGQSTTSQQFKQKGHVHLPIKNPGITTMTLKNRVYGDTLCTITIDVVSKSLDTIKSASGFDIEYNKEYFITSSDLKGQRGGLFFTPHLNSDRLYFDNSVKNLGSTMIFENALSVKKEKINWGDLVNIRSTRFNWSNSNFWNTNSNTAWGINLSKNPSNYYISGNSDGTIGLSQMEADLFPNGNIGFFLRKLITENIGTSWLNASNRILIGQNFNENSAAEVFAGLEYAHNHMKIYEKDYSDGFNYLNLNETSISYSLNSRYHNATVRYLLKVNDAYVSESYNGKAYYSSVKNSSNESETVIFSSYSLSHGDKVTLEVITNEPGYSTDKSATIQTLFETTYKKQ